VQQKGSQLVNNKFSASCGFMRHTSNNSPELVRHLHVKPTQTPGQTESTALEIPLPIAAPNSTTRESADLGLSSATLAMAAYTDSDHWISSGAAHRCVSE
jgi:hypothetical protein